MYLKKMNVKKKIYYLFLIIVIASLFLLLIGGGNEPNIKIKNIAPELKYLWLGRENAETGKKVPQESFLFVEFNKEVKLNLLRNAMRMECDEGEEDNLYGKERPVVPINIVYPNELWNNMIKDSDQKFPADFNAVSFGEMKGFSHIQGPIASGGDLELLNLNVNDETDHEIGIIAGDDLILSNGKVNGDIYYFKKYNEQNLELIGEKREKNIINYDLYKRRLDMLSSFLCSLPVNGDTYVENFSVILNGDSSELNIFEISAYDLSMANSFDIKIPEGSTAVINVTGSNVEFSNLYMNLNGASNRKIFWNMKDVDNVAVSNISFQGTILAVNADVNFTNGNFEGTLIAGSIKGNGEFHYFPFESWDDFDSLNRVYFWWDNDIDTSQVYTLVIDDVSINDNGDALTGPFSIDFMVMGLYKKPFEAETYSVMWNKQKNTPDYFKIKNGINTDTQDMFKRFKKDIGIRSDSDELICTRSLSRSITMPEYNLSYYAQYYKGVPVPGFGYSVFEDEGGARICLGKFIRDLDININPSISDENALNRALSELQLYSSYPWEENPEKYKKPEPELIIKSRSDRQEKDDFILVWQINLRDSGVRSADHIDINANTSEVISVEGTKKYCTKTDLHDPVSAVSYYYFDNEDGTDDIFELQSVKYKDSEGNNHYMLERESPMKINVYVGTEDEFYNDVTSDDLFACSPDEFWNENREQAYAVLYDAVLLLCDFYKKNFKTSQEDNWLGTDGKGLAELSLIISDGDDWTDSSIHAPFWFKDLSENQLKPMIFFRENRFFKDSNGNEYDEKTKFLDAYYYLGHEYSHAVDFNGRFHNGMRKINYEKESGIIQEGFANIMSRMHFKDSWFNKYNGDLLQFIDPEACNPPQPTTYKGNYWMDTDENPDEVHHNVTVINYFAYLLETGKDQGENDLGRKYTVCKVSDNIVDARDIVSHIMFDAEIDLLPGGDPTFHDLRTATITAAEALYPPEPGKTNVVRSVKQAWYAVGVDDNPFTTGDILPEDKSTQVDPWPAKLSWYADYPGEWEIQVSKTVYFNEEDIVYSDTVEGKQPGDDAEFTTVDNLPMTTVNVELEQDTKYYWRVRPEYDDNLEWKDKCYSFNTRKYELEVKYSPCTDGVYTTDQEIAVWFKDYDYKVNSVRAEDFDVEMDIFKDNDLITTVNINTANRRFIFDNLALLNRDGIITENTIYEIKVSLTPKVHENRKVEQLYADVAYLKMKLISPGIPQTNDPNIERPQFPLNYKGLEFEWERINILNLKNVLNLNYWDFSTPTTKLIPIGAFLYDLYNTLDNSDLVMSMKFTNDTTPTKDPYYHAWWIDLFNNNGTNLRKGGKPFCYSIDLPAPEKIDYFFGTNEDDRKKLWWLEWKHIEGANQYYINIWERDKNGNKIEPPVISCDTCKLFPPDMGDGKTGYIVPDDMNLNNPYGYYVSVSAKHLYGKYKNWKEIKFALPLQKVEIISPADGDFVYIGDDHYFKFSQVPGAVKYRVVYSEYFTNSIHEYYIYPDNSSDILIHVDKDLKKIKKVCEIALYVTPINVDDEKDVNAGDSIRFPQYFHPPELITPDSNQTFKEGDPVKIKWQPVDGADEYRIIVHEEDGPRCYEHYGLASTSVTLRDLKLGDDDKKKYYIYIWPVNRIQIEEGMPRTKGRFYITKKDDDNTYPPETIFLDGNNKSTKTYNVYSKSGKFDLEFYTHALSDKITIKMDGEKIHGGAHPYEFSSVDIYNKCVELGVLYYTIDFPEGGSMTFYYTGKVRYSGLEFSGKSTYLEVIVEPSSEELFDKWWYKIIFKE